MAGEYSHLSSTVPTANTDSAPIEIVCNIFRHVAVTRRLTSSSKSARIHYLLSPVHAVAGAPLLLWAPLMDQHFCRHHIPRSPASAPPESDVPLVCMKFVVDDMKLSPIWGDVVPPRGVANRCPSGLSISRIPRSNLWWFIAQNSAACFNSRMFSGLKHFEFTNGAHTLPLFILLILDILLTSPLLETFIETYCILPGLDTCVPLLLHPIYGGFA